MKFSNREHLSDVLVLRTIDDELSVAERLECESHLSGCEICRHKLASLRELSLEVEAAVHLTPVPSMDAVRQIIQHAIETNSSPAAGFPHPSKVMRRFGWGMGIAATLALGVLLAPRHDLTPPPSLDKPVSRAASAVRISNIEVDGEIFTPVPYSNADLPISSSHIVQMQVPISSLADVGIVLEPVANRAASEIQSERSVLADVLVGADGQPRGVRVLDLE